MGEVFELLKTLPNYFVSRAPKMGEVKRVLRLAGMLVHEGIDKEADEEVRSILIKKLKELRDTSALSDPQWSDFVREGGEIAVDVNMVGIGQMNVIGTTEIRSTLSEENIDRLFDAAGGSWQLVRDCTVLIGNTITTVTNRIRQSWSCLPWLRRVRLSPMRPLR